MSFLAGKNDPISKAEGADHPGVAEMKIGKNPRSGTVLNQLLSKPLGAVGPK
jgi:hypothetical protein